ncbi:hypothetical protein ACLB2K_040969 [Fragaria x ananassa]
MELMIKSLSAYGCLVLGGVVIKGLFRCRKPSWETLPDDIMEPLSSIPMRKDISSSRHTLPWLILPQPESKALTCNDTSLSFFNLYHGKVVKLELPEPVHGVWFRGCSKGWLIMIKEDEHNSSVFLVNPISGVHHQLPSTYVETATWKKYGAFTFYNRLVLSTSVIDLEECIVAATLGRFTNKILVLCRPRDKEWNVFQLTDANVTLTDILFSCGKLYALVVSKYKMAIVATPRMLNFGDQLLELKLVYDVNPNYSDIDKVVEDHGNYEVFLQDCCNSHLLESTCNNETTSTLENRGNNLEEEENGGGGNDVEEEENDEGYDGGDKFEGEGGDGEFQINMFDENYRFTYLRTSGFEIYRIDPHNGSLKLVPSLGDKVIFLSHGGSLSLRPSDVQSKDVGGNCIYFATNNIKSFHSLETYISREIGVFNLDKRSIQ